MYGIMIIITKAMIIITNTITIINHHNHKH